MNTLRQDKTSPSSFPWTECHMKPRLNFSRIKPKPVFPGYVFHIYMQSVSCRRIVVLYFCWRLSMPEAVRLACSQGGFPRGGVLALQNLSCIGQVCFHLAGIAVPGLCEAEQHSPFHVSLTWTLLIMGARGIGHLAQSYFLVRTGKWKITVTKSPDLPDMWRPILCPLAAMDLQMKEIN